MRKPIQVILPAVILLAGVIMMVFGILLGEPQEILRKAVVVCLECIGLG